ncbi:MAG: DNA polymerase domain-containing protein [Promethearchaeota archaeon]
MDSQEEFDGWLLDATTSGDGMTLWIKTAKEQEIVMAHHDFFPEFFAVPKIGIDKDFESLKTILISHPHVKRVQTCEKYVTLEEQERSTVFGVLVEKPSVFKSTIKQVNEIGLFTLYNTDIPISQMYFYANDLFPMAMCHFKVARKVKHAISKEVLHVTSVELNDDNEAVLYELPSLKAVWIDVKIQQKGFKPYFNEPIAHAEISVVQRDDNGIPRADGKKEKRISIDSGDEAGILIKISEIVQELDPDIILTCGGDEFLFPYLAARAAENGVSSKMLFSRTKTPLKNCIFNISGSSDHYMSYGIIMRRSRTQVYFTGRFHLDTTAYGSLHFSEGNIPGVIEVARVSRVPLQRLCRITIGGALQSIQFYNAYKLDHLVPPFKKSPEGFRTGMDLIKGDRGGHIFEPMIGVFDQVVELDFSSMYPSLMANFNISSETINCGCCKEDKTGIKVPGLDFHICSKREGIISKSIRLPLEKRLKYKQIARETGKTRYKFTDIALKWVLVVSFGYLGFRNARFGKIEAHQTVCAFAREFLMRSAEIAQKHGCRVIHGIVDSIWLQDTEGRGTEEFEEVTKRIAKEITEHTSIAMSWNGLFDFIVFLPSRAELEIPTLNHYWGVKKEGEVKVRGIEIRRRDAPNILKDAQRAFIEAFKGAKSVNEFISRIPKVKKILYEYVDKIETGKVSREELTIKQKISRKPLQYKVNSYQAVAARQLEKSGVIASAGKNVRYIILNANASPEFPERKVILADLYDDKKHHYDKKKYIELLKRAFENILPFSFPELDELVKTDYNRKSTQKNIIDFV